MPRKPTPPPEKIPVFDYPAALAAALHQQNVPYSLYFLISAVAKLQNDYGHATIPGVAYCMAQTYQAIQYTILRNRDYFTIEYVRPKRIVLTNESIKLLGKIQTNTKFYAEFRHPAS